jgi:signal recognition particle subunit SRP54
VKQFDVMSQIMTSMAGKGMRERMKMMQQVQSGMMANPDGLSKQKKGTGKRLTPKERAQLKKEREKEMRRRKREQKRGQGPEGNGEA